MRKIIDRIKTKTNKIIKKINKPSELPYQERLDKFTKEYKDLANKYQIDFTMMPIDLKRVYQEDGVTKLKPE